MMKRLRPAMFAVAPVTVLAAAAGSATDIPQATAALVAPLAATASITAVEPPAPPAQDFSTDSSETEAPATRRPASLSALVAESDGSSELNAEERCLATAVYFESKGEPLEGQLAVAQVILNRAESGRFPSSICGVVNQPSQFTYDRSRAPRESIHWRNARAIARIAMADAWTDIVPKALYFHATRVSPGWASAKRLARIGNHIFYR